MSEIFYSQVDLNLQAELNARAIGGKSNRSTRALNHMLGKIANVEITAYEDETYNKVIDILGGSQTRFDKFLPNGFLREQQYNLVNNQIDFNQSNQVLTTEGSFIDSSKRIPPVITSANITIGDHSMGLLNKATINITIPNPDRDLNYFESTWMRPGRYARIKFAHPESALVLENDLLTDSILPSFEKIQERYPEITPADYKEFRKLNQVLFDGLITSFTLNYQPDGSVQVTLMLTGTSNIYTDVSLLIDTDKTPDNSIKTDIPGSSDIIINDQANNASNGESVAEQTDTTTKPINYIFNELETELDKLVLKQSLNEEIKKNGNQVIQRLNEGADTLDEWAIYGKPYATGSATYERYVTLAYLIRFINESVLIKFNSPIAIICDETVTTGVYYKNIISADPDRILLMSNDLTTNFFGIGSIEFGIDPILYYSDINESQANFNNTAEQVSYPTKIFINLEVIKEITDGLITKNNSFNVSNFFRLLSAIIKTNTGNAVDLKLITHPEGGSLLLYYDANKVITKNSSGNVTEYAIPMFANDPRGTIVREFNFSTKLPDSIKSLSYVLNQDPDKISEQDIAPYMNFMYLNNTVKREQTSTGIRDIINPDAQTQATDLANKYAETYQKYQEQLNQAKVEFSKNPTSPNNRGSLLAALRKYIQYPTANIQTANQLTAPIFPFDAEFTIDGINGFRYGDVLQFNALPERYRRNTVFSIINIDHTVSTSGEWTTKIRCIMRPKLQK
jgi:hypothetical protein